MDMTKDAVTKLIHLSKRKVKDSGPKRRMTPAVTPIVRRNVEKAEDNEIGTQYRKLYSLKTRTIDLVLHLLPITHEGSFDPVPRKHQPSNDAESVPAQVHQRSFGVPQAFPELWFLKGVEDIKILDGCQRGRASMLLGTSIVEQVRCQWDYNRNECRPKRSAKLVRGRAWV